MSADYLRISVTDRCNLRCVYCHPLGGCDFIDRAEILHFEEIDRIVRLFAVCGIRKVRLTGGEPLVRKGIAQLGASLAGIEGIEELALTTNGVLLGPMAAELKNAHLQRVNISLDSAQRENFKVITGFDLFDEVMQGIRRALDVGLTPVKINSVIIKSVNFPQIQALAELSVSLPVAVRFIEYNPTGRNTMPADDYVPNERVREIIERRFGKLSQCPKETGAGPAVNFEITDSAGQIGFISGRSSTFCQSCNRIRLSSDGRIRPCLYSAHYYDIKKPVRAGAGDAELLELLKRILSEKGGYTKLNSPNAEFCMQNIGG